MRQLYLCIITSSILSVFRWDFYICKDKIPRVWKTHAKVNGRGYSTINSSVSQHGLVGPKRVTLNGKAHVLECTRSGEMQHTVAVFTFTFTSNVTKEVDRRLLVKEAVFIFRAGAIFTHVLGTVVWNEGIEFFPIIGPSWLERYTIECQSQNISRNHSIKIKSQRTQVSCLLHRTLLQSVGP